MYITIYSAKSQGQKGLSADMAKSFKKREGIKPASLYSSVTLEIDAEKINLAWKKRLAAQIRLPNYYHVKRVVIDGEGVNTASNNPEQIANLIANHILNKRSTLQIGNKNFTTMIFNKFLNSKI